MIVLPEKALDKIGFVIDQDSTSPIPFGRKGSVECGCGWIATFNLRHWRGDDVLPETVAAFLHKISPLSGLMGVNVLPMHIYLLFLGFRALLLPVTKRRAGHCGDAGIIMYKVRKGGHYVAYYKVGEDKYRFLNGIYGKEDHVCSMTEFVSERSKWPIALILRCKGKAAANILAADETES